MKIKKMAQESGIFLASVQEIYKRMARGGLSGFAIPAFNLRTLTFDAARAIFRAAKKEKAGIFIIELARSEMEYTCQPPHDYAICILAAAVEEEWSGPIFLQADHFSLKDNDLKESKALLGLMKESLNEGFYNIDIDCSALAELSRESPEDQQRKNFIATAHFVNALRKLEPRGIILALGGEVSSIGGSDTTVEELRVFLEGFNQELARYDSINGLAKISCQMATAHGGMVLPSGKLAPIQIDFSCLSRLSKEAKKYGLAGVVQHGASTLPDDCFANFVEAGVCEVHLSTQFQNIILDNVYFPSALKERIYSWLKANFSFDMEKYKSETQFLYKIRKKALGVFKKEIWDMPKKNIDRISEELEEKFIFFFRSLNVKNTQELIEEIFTRRA